MDRHEHLHLECKIDTVWLLVDISVRLTLQQLVVVLPHVELVQALHDLGLLAGALPLLHCLLRGGLGLALP